MQNLAQFGRLSTNEFGWERFWQSLVASKSIAHSCGIQSRRSSEPVRPRGSKQPPADRRLLMPFFLLFINSTKIYLKIEIYLCVCLPPRI